MREGELEVRDSHRLFYRAWEIDAPKATVHINHGMAEHSGRYSEFAGYLNSLGFAVYAQDHRGHGLTGEEDERGWFSEKEGAMTVVEDSYEVDQAIMGKHPDIPHFIFGHSMGSFITRTVITMHPVFDAAVICGTGADQGLLGKIGKRIAMAHVRKWGSKMKDDDLDHLAFGSYNKNFKGEGKFAWLTRDAKQVAIYEEDPLCGFVCSSGFYADLIDLVGMANDRARAERIPKNMPMLIISGAADPVGGYSRGVKKVYEMYRKAGIKNLSLKLYDGARHEILNETNREEVFKDIGTFLSGCLDKSNAQ